MAHSTITLTPPYPKECFINVYAVANALSKGMAMQQGPWHLYRRDAIVAARVTGPDWQLAYRIRVKMKGTKS